MKKLFLVALVATCLAGSAQAQEKEKVAVYVTGAIENADLKIIGSKAVSRISRSDEYVAVERTDTFLKAITREQDYQLSGEVRDDQIAALGKRFGVRYVAVFEVSRLGDDSCFIAARMIDVESGLVRKSIDANRKIASTNDLVALTNNVAFRLISKTSK